MEFGLKALEGLLINLGVCSGWLACAENGHYYKNLEMAACAGFIGSGECVRLVLLAVCSDHPAGRIEGDFEFLPAPVDLDIRIGSIRFRIVVDLCDLGLSLVRI